MKWTRSGDTLIVQETGNDAAFEEPILDGLLPGEWDGRSDWQIHGSSLSDQQLQLLLDDRFYEPPGAILSRQ